MYKFFKHLVLNIVEELIGNSINCYIFLFHMLFMRFLSTLESLSTNRAGMLLQKFIDYFFTYNFKS